MVMLADYIYIWLSFFFFKQKTAYEMRISDRSSDVCSSDLAYRDEIITPAEETALIAGIEAAGLTPFQFQQWEGKRLTRSFGWTYDFQTGRFAPGEPIPFWLDAIRSRAARFAGIDPDTLEQALVLQYGIGRSEEHNSELQSLKGTPSAVF